MQCGAEVVKLRKDECRELDRRTKNIMCANDALYPRADVAHGIYIGKKKGGRRLLSV